MAKRINDISRMAERVVDTGPVHRRIEPQDFAEALGAEPCGERLPTRLDPIALAELGTALLRRLRSTGGRPTLADATERCKVPLSAEDVAGLEEIMAQVEKATGTRPSLGQTAAVIIREYLKGGQRDAASSTPEAKNERATALQQLARRVDDLVASLQASAHAVEELARQLRQGVRG